MNVSAPSSTPMPPAPIEARAPARPRLVAFARGTLVYTIGVILWGAYVRASGSGAGCGSHWPTCNGEVIPRAPSTATVIELTHRVTSGLALWLVVGVAIASFRATPRGHLARRASLASVFFMTTEALVGAGLVVFERVAGDKSIARGWWMSAHLINTFLLLASMLAATWAASRDDRPSTAGRTPQVAAIAGASLAMLATGVTGAIAALGDTLFPAKSFAEGLAHELSAQAHLFVRLRVLHPFVAVGTAVGVAWMSSRVARTAPPRAARAASMLGFAILTQSALGVVNLLLAAPTWMQLVHLFAADVVWLVLMVLGLELLAAPQSSAAPNPAH